ncbi:TPA: hypothetical protein ACNH3N_005260 [Klebsiella variicola]
MENISFDASELVKQYRGERGIVEGEPCPKCSKLGVKNPIYYYRDIGSKTGKGRCLSCYHIEGNKPTSQQETHQELSNGDKVYEGKRCRNCDTRLRIFDEATRERLNVPKRTPHACYKCALMKIQTIEPVAAHRDFEEMVRRAVWKFYIRSVQASGYVEVIAKDPLERSQIKQLIATCSMMNRHAELANETQRYAVDHYFPAVGENNIRGMTNIYNLRIIKQEDNASKKDTIPTSYAANQIIDIRECVQLHEYMEASKALKEWVDDTSDTTFTVERKALYEAKKKRNADKVAAIQNRLSDELSKAVYAAIDESQTTLFDVLVMCQSKLRRFKTGGNMQLVERYKQRLALHGNRGFVKVEPPDLEAMAYIGKGAVLWAVEATVSNVIDGITLLHERGMTEQEQRIVDAITFDCLGWALSAMESTAEVMPFVSPLLAVFGDKVFSVINRYGKMCLTVYTNDRKGQFQKMADADQLTPFDGWELAKVPFLSASDGNVLDRLAEFDNQTLAMQRQKQAAADAKAEAIQSIKQRANDALNAIHEARERIEADWLALVEKAKQNLCSAENEPEDNAAILVFFGKQWKHYFDDALNLCQQKKIILVEFIRTPFSEPKDAADTFKQLHTEPPRVSVDPFQPVPDDTAERERLRVIGERLEKQDAEKAEARAADKANRSKKAEFLRSPQGQAWLADQKRQQRNPRHLTPHGRSRDNRH